MIHLLVRLTPSTHWTPLTGFLLLLGIVATNTNLSLEHFRALYKKITKNGDIRN